MAVNQFGQPVGRLVPGWSARARPRPGVLAGEHVRLEPLADRHVGDLFAQTCGPGREPLWTYLPIGPFDTARTHAAALAALVGDPSLVPLAIVPSTTGGAVGMASYLRIEPAAGCLEVGWVLFGPRLARTGAATEAMYLMARHAFDDLGYRRVEWKCDALNQPSRSAAVRLGFRPEGTFRQASVVKGRNRDTAWYAMTDDDWRVLAPVYADWLNRGQEGAGALSELTRRALARVAR
ncbi:MAG TPA: GNAT family protein [Dermatophilaceae bacterium]|nr:GNAT family protein [Dermatophilaceae bacterium]